MSSCGHFIHLTCWKKLFACSGEPMDQRDHSERRYIKNRRELASREVEPQNHMLKFKCPCCRTMVCSPDLHIPKDIFPGVTDNDSDGEEVTGWFEERPCEPALNTTAQRELARLSTFSHSTLGLQGVHGIVKLGKSEIVQLLAELAHFPSTVQKMKYFLRNTYDEFENRFVESLKRRQKDLSVREENINDLERRVMRKNYNAAERDRLQQETEKELQEARERIRRLENELQNRCRRANQQLHDGSNQAQQLASILHDSASGMQSQSDEPTTKKRKFEDEVVVVDSSDENGDEN